MFQRREFGVEILGTIAGTAMFVMSILFILLAVGVPLIKPDLPTSTANMDKDPETYIPKFDFSYLQRLRFLFSQSEGRVYVTLCS